MAADGLAAVGITAEKMRVAKPQMKERVARIELERLSARNLPFLANGLDVRRTPGAVAKV